MVGTLLFELPADRSRAELCLLGFVAAFREAMGGPLDAAGVQSDLADGLHCHVLWAGRSMTNAEQEAVAALWPHGLVLLSHTRESSVSRKDDLAAWESLGSR